MAHQRELHTVVPENGGTEVLEYDGYEIEPREPRSSRVEEDGKDEEDGEQWLAVGISMETFQKALERLYQSLRVRAQSSKDLEQANKRLKQVGQELRECKRTHPTTWRNEICGRVQRNHGVRLSAYFGIGGSGTANEDSGPLMREASNECADVDNSYGVPDSHAKLYRTPGNKFVPSNQHDDYEHRGTDLGGLSPYEYVGVVRVETLKASDDKDDETGPLRFAPNVRGDHPLADTHCQKLRSKYLVPMLSSASNPPPFPGPRPIDRASKEYHTWLDKAGSAAEYYGAVFMPHDIATGKAPCQGVDKLAAWDQFCGIMKSYHLASAATNADYVVLNARFATIYNIAHVQRSSGNCNRRTRTHRGRFSDLLDGVKRGKYDTGVFGDDPASAAAATQDYMSALIADERRGVNPVLLRQEKQLYDLFGPATTGVSRCLRCCVQL